MDAFTILLILSVVGIGAVFWILKNDSNESPNSTAPVNESEVLNTPLGLPPKTSLLSKLTSFKEKLGKSTTVGPESKSKTSTSLLVKVLSKMKFGKNKSDETSAETPPLPNLNEYLGSEKQEANQTIQDEHITSEAQAPFGTASVKTTSTETSPEEKTLSHEEEEKIAKEIELSSELSELKEKYDKLETLFSEKSTEYEKAKESLNNELENRKEFNKVKDLLEKEIKDSKDKTRSVEGELNNAQTENENQKKHTAQLEEKSSQLEKDLLEKEDKINDLVKRMQTFASPTTAATPPEVEEKEEDKSGGETPVTDQTPADQSPDNQPHIDPPSENIQTETEETSPPIENKETPSQSTESPQEPEKTETELVKKDEEKGAPKQKSSEEPAQESSFKLDLSIDEEPSENTEKESFLKLQPDVLSGESKEEDSRETSDKPQQPPPENTSEDQESNP